MLQQQIVYGLVQQSAFKGASPGDQLVEQRYTLLVQANYLVFFLILSTIVFCQVIFSAQINTESVCAALSEFLLIVYMGFFMFSAIENHMSGAFRGLSHEELQMMNELFYYSFISILTVGYGDIVAVSWPDCNTTILVILTGYIYSLFFIARIVSEFSVSEKITCLNCHFDVLYLLSICIRRW